MNSLEWINAEIVKWQEILESFKEQLIRVKGTRNEETTLNHIKADELKLQYLQQIKTELKLLNELKNLINTGDIFSPSEFYDEYESCLKGDGSATFITKDLEIIEDFEKGWKLLRKEIDKYGTFSPHKCKIALVVWFNR